MLFRSRNVSHDAYDSHVYDSRAMFAPSSSYVYDRNVTRRNVVPKRNAIHHVPRRNVTHAPRKVVNEPSTIYCALNTSFAICRKDTIFHAGVHLAFHVARAFISAVIENSLIM